MATATADRRPQPLAAVEAGKVYPLPLFKSSTGLSAWALRQARRRGLKMVTIGRRKFVRGSDFLDFLATVEG